MEEPFVFANLQTRNNKSVLLQLSQLCKICLGLLIVLSLFWGTALKIFVYSYYKKLKISDRPISILILLDQIVNHILNIYIGLNLVIELFFSVSPTQFFGNYFGFQLDPNMYCMTFYFLSSFMVTNHILGNSLLALYRTFYLKMTDFVTVKVGEKCVLCFAIVVDLSISALMSILFVQGKSSTRSVYNLCMGHSQKFQVS